MGRLQPAALAEFLFPYMPPGRARRPGLSGRADRAASAQRPALLLPRALLPGASRRDSTRDIRRRSRCRWSGSRSLRSWAHALRFAWAYLGLPTRERKRRLNDVSRAVSPLSRAGFASADTASADRLFRGSQKGSIRPDLGLPRRSRQILRPTRSASTFLPSLGATDLIISATFNCILPNPW